MISKTSDEPAVEEFQGSLQDVDFGCPWPLRVSPYLDRARDHALAWMEEFGLTQDPEANERQYRDWKLGELAAFNYPDATPEGLDLGADLMGWYFVPFDDAFDGELGRDPRGAATICGDLMAILDLPDDALLPAVYPVAAAFADIWRRSRRAMSTAWQQRTAQHWRQYLIGQLAEVINRRHHRSPDAVSNLRQRVVTTSAEVVLDLYERVSGYEVPDMAWQMPVLYELRQLSAEIISITNDLVSAEKEEAQRHGQQPAAHLGEPGGLFPNRGGGADASDDPRTLRPVSPLRAAGPGPR